MNKFIESILSKDYVTAEKEFNKEISERVNDTVENIKQEISESLLESAGSAKQSYKVYYQDPESKKEYTTVLKANSHSHAKRLVRKFAGADVNINDSKQLNEAEALEESKAHKMEEMKDANNNGVCDDEEQLDEISKKTLGSYLKKAGEDYAQTAIKMQQTRSARDRITHLSNTNDFSTDEMKSVRKAQNDMYDANTKKEHEIMMHGRKRKAGIDKAVDKLTKE